MRALKWVSLAVLLAACGNDAGTGEQRNAELPGGLTGLNAEDAETTDAERDGDEIDAAGTLRDDERDDARDAEPEMSSAGWTAVEGADFNAIIGTSGLDMDGEISGSASASVRRDGFMYALGDADRGNRAAAVWTAVGVGGGGDIVLSFDLEGASGQEGWIGVTLSHRSDDRYARTHCAFSPNGEGATLISDNATGEAQTSGSTMRCALESDIERGDLDIYFYPTAYSEETGWNDGLTGEVFVSNIRLSVRD